MAKRSSKISHKQTSIVRIRKLKVNYELRYDYLKVLSEFIKRLPKEHRKVRVDNIVTPDGSTKDEWVRIISPGAISKIISFLIDNSIKFAFENITSDEIDRLRNEYIERIKRINKLLRLKAESLDITNESYDFLKIQPYDYQKQAVKFFEINNGVSILGDQPGVGKTLPTLAYAVKHKIKALVICPASLKLNWRKEILRFTYEKAFVFKYKPRKKSKQIAYSKKESMFHITNYEAVESYIKPEYKHKCHGKMLKPDGKSGTCGWEVIDLVKKYKECPICQNTGTIKTRMGGLVYFGDSFKEELDPDDYGLIILDECHKIKEQKTTWTKIIKEAFKNIPKKLLLSGTVIKNRPQEFFSSLNFLDKKEWNNSHEFGIRYGAGYENNFGWDYSGASNLEELFERVSPYFLRRLKKDVLKDLPPKTYTDIPIELTEEEYRQYNKIEKELKKQIVNGVEVEKEETFIEKIHKLKIFTGKIKANRVKEMIQDILDGGEKVVVFSDYIDIAKNIHDYFGDASVLHTGSMDINDKQESVDTFQEKKHIKVFSGMIIASGAGLTLTAASKLIFLGFAWSPSDMEQAEDRIHRVTTTADNVQIIRLICQDTIDEDIDELLKEKSQVLAKVLDNKDYRKDINISDESIFSELINRIKNK